MSTKRVSDSLIWMLVDRGKEGGAKIQFSCGRQQICMDHTSYMGGPTSGSNSNQFLKNHQKFIILPHIKSTIHNKIIISKQFHNIQINQ